MKVFGWHELNESAFGIESLIVDKIEQDLDSDYAEELIIDVDEEGMWFRTFSAAKKAQIAIFKYQIQWRKDAIAEIRKTLRKNT